MNQHTIKDKMPLLLIRKVIDKLKNAKYLNKLDLIWKYKNVQIKEDNKWKAAFLTNKRLFELKEIYFGLCKLPGIFQQMMNSIFRKLIQVLVNYIDDFVIPSKTKKELEERIV